MPNHKEPHNHPILPPTKTPVAIKEIQELLVVQSVLLTMARSDLFFWHRPHKSNAFGILARTTKQTLGSSPSLYAPTLQNNRIKQDIIWEEKKKNPCGTDVPGK